MSDELLILGVDPGTTTGLVALGARDGRITDAQALQCSAGWARWLVRSMLDNEPGARRVVAVERFVVGPRAARSSTPGAGALTRDLIGALLQTADQVGALFLTRPAADVKPWATDRRLDAAGLLAPCTGMGHARDAARMALYSAVRDCGLPDPLIRHHTPR